MSKIEDMSLIDTPQQWVGFGKPLFSHSVLLPCELVARMLLHSMEMTHCTSLMMEFGGRLK